MHTSKIEGKILQIIIRLAMTCGAEYRPIKKQHLHKMTVADMRMLRWRCGKTRIDRIRDACFREHLGVASIGQKLREICLRWFQHVKHKPTTTP